MSAWFVSNSSGVSMKAASANVLVATSEAGALDGAVASSK